MPNPFASTSVLHRGKSWLAAAFMAGVACSPAYGGDPGAADKLAKSVLEPEPESRVHVLLNLEFSDHYITPRGLDVENQGVVFQPLALILWDLYSSKSGFLNDVTLTTGVWNSWHTHKSGVNPGEWNEIDPITGLTFKVANDFSFDAFY